MRSASGERGNRGESGGVWAEVLRVQCEEWEEHKGEPELGLRGADKDLLGREWGEETGDGVECG